MCIRSSLYLCGCCKNNYCKIVVAMDQYYVFKAPSASGSHCPIDFLISTGCGFWTRWKGAGLRPQYDLFCTMISLKNQTDEPILPVVLLSNYLESIRYDCLI